MPLVKCNLVYGGSGVLAGRPAVRVLTNAIFVPPGCPDATGGLYDENQTFVTETAFMQGVPQLAHCADFAFSIDLKPRSVYREARCLYIGPLHPHYGHFLISTLSRLWLYREHAHRFSDVRILYQPGRDPSGSFFRNTFAMQLLAILGIDQSRLITFDEAMTIETVIVPAASFIENHAVYPEFAAFTHWLGKRLIADRPAVPNDTPVYLTKHKLSQGVTRIHGEERLAERLARAGFDIVAPEELTLPDQVALLRERSVVCGLNGSAFHTSVFLPGKKYLVLNSEMQVWSNQVLIDTANGNDTVFLHPRDDISPIAGDTADYAMNYLLHRPEQTAEELLRLLDPFRRLPPGAGPRGRGTGSADPRTRVLRPLGANISRGKFATQSSLSQWSVGGSLVEDAAGAVNGRLTGRSQFHTDLEAEPWWEVDLGCECCVHGIWLFNTSDPMRYRANGIRVLGARDHGEWTELFRANGPFEGKTGEPMIWQADHATRARYIRVILPGGDFLHLDQVEVFGEPADLLDDVLADFAFEPLAAAAEE